ncbi:GNAT family N-acetyltransferase [Trujillonella endophytica]|uniref:Ribosomal protein S18 acetylase RimI n=1 Tax=Trujillonella endophytica TaxID=673521 RepID=A0A1H8VG72_9ACTN|nr:GNAT family N-acetyltransferase [Trujillella endophytica]SEP14330.1 Ribosomal protein S18 acetylase RimI [Trujillella endophytica]
MEPPRFPRLTGDAAVSVRPARPDDAPDMARVQAVTWRTAFRSVLPADVLDEWDEAAAAEVWRATVVRPPTPAHGVVVALDGATVVGFAAYGPPEVDPGEPASADGPTTELAILLVEPRWGRRGHGSRLLAAVADLAGATGAARLSMWVAEADEVTARFLESAGWARAGWARTLDTGDEPLREVRWHAELDGEGVR